MGSELNHNQHSTSPVQILGRMSQRNMFSNLLYVCLQHRGIPYCNIPCYSLLFGPGGYGRGGVESHQKLGFQTTLKPDQVALRYVNFVFVAFCNDHQLNLWMNSLMFAYLSIVLKISNSSVSVPDQIRGGHQKKGGDKKIVQRNTIEKASGKEGKRAIKYLQISAKKFQHKRISEKLSNGLSLKM